MSDSLVIQETKPVWLTISNSDLTEGRGHPVIIAASWTPETALRLGRKQDVQGGDCRAIKALAVKVDGTWLAPRDIIKENDFDAKARAAREAAEAAEVRKQLALAKARSLGMSDADIAALGVSA